MADNNEIIKALGQVPELVETTKRVLAEFEKIIKILGEVGQKRVQAEIPSTELEKISKAAMGSVAQTRCATPDTSEVSRHVADNITKFFSESVRGIITRSVKDAVADTPVTVEHHHTHTTLRYMCEMAEETLRNWILGLAIYGVIITIAGFIFAFSFFNGEKHLGAQYADIYFSDYTTEAEKKMLNADTYMVGFIPNEFSYNPQLVKQKIKRNRQIIRQRKLEASTKSGRFSVNPSLER